MMNDKPFVAISYDEFDQASYRAVLVKFNGKSASFSSGNFPTDWKAALTWMESVFPTVYEEGFGCSSSVFDFFSDGDKYRYEDFFDNGEEGVDAIED